MSVRASFVARFGEECAVQIETAAVYHRGSNRYKGSDPFKWALLICIGYNCVGAYRVDHGITIDASDFTDWCIMYGELGSHDGDCNYIALASGDYDIYMPAESPQEPA